jgi:hypothetical protein
VTHNVSSAGREARPLARLVAGLAIAAAVICSACHDVVLGHRLPTVIDDRIAGRWIAGDQRMLVERGANGAYTVTRIGTTLEPETWYLGRYGGVTFAQEATQCGKIHVFNPHEFTSCWEVSVLAVLPNGEVEQRFFDLDALEANSRAGAFRGVVHTVASVVATDGDRHTCALFGGEPADVGPLLARYAVRPGVFSHTSRWRRSTL